MPAGKLKSKRRSVHLILIIGPIGRIGPILTLFPFAWLREAEPVAGVVFEDRFDAVGSFGAVDSLNHRSLTTKALSHKFCVLAPLWLILSYGFGGRGFCKAAAMNSVMPTSL